MGVPGDENTQTHLRLFAGDRHRVRAIFHTVHDVHNTSHDRSRVRTRESQGQHQEDDTCYNVAHVLFHRVHLS